MIINYRPKYEVPFLINGTKVGKIGTTDGIGGTITKDNCIVFTDEELRLIDRIDHPLTYQGIKDRLFDTIEIGA